MNALPTQFQLSLAHKAMFSIADAAGLNIVCREGSLWLTLDDDPRDVVLDAGESFLTTEHRRALIYALSPSSLSVVHAVEPTPATSTSRPATSPVQVTLAFQPA